MDKKKKQTPGMADIENVIEVLDEQEKAERRKLWLKEHKQDGNPQGGDKKEDLHQG